MKLLNKIVVYEKPALHFFVVPPFEEEKRYNCYYLYPMVLIIQKHLLKVHLVERLCPLIILSIRQSNVNCLVIEPKNKSAVKIIMIPFMTYYSDLCYIGLHLFSLSGKNGRFNLWASLIFV
jgi:hypothetical protein